MASYTSESSALYGSATGYVVVDISHEDGATTASITCNFYINAKDASIIQSTSRNSASISSPSYGDASVNLGPYGSISWDGTRLMATVTQDITLLNESKTEYLSYSLNIPLPANPSYGRPANYFDFSGSVEVSFPAGTPPALSISNFSLWWDPNHRNQGTESFAVFASFNGTYGTGQSIDFWQAGLSSWSGWDNTPSTTSLDYGITLNSSHRDGSITANKKFSIDARFRDNFDQWAGSASSYVHCTAYTSPKTNSVSLQLVSGLEYDQIKATINIEHDMAEGGDQFAFKLGDTTWSAWQTSKEFTFTNLTENTNYIIYAKMKNTNSGLESNEVNNNITTWYDPLTNLQIKLTDRWYWYIAITSTYTYNGSISKFEFAISDSEGYQDKGTTNSHSKGTKTENHSTNLLPHTLYNCYVKLTDNHGRQYTASAQFYTLEDRLATVIEANGGSTFVQAYIVEANGATKQMTPDLVSVVEANGATTVFPNTFP